MKLKNILFLLIALSLTGCKSNDILWLNGQWEGVGCQLDFEETYTWSINLNINATKKLFNIEYPSLKCNGNWELIDYSNGRAIFSELIIENTNACIEKGKVILTKVDENHISFSYYILNENEVVAFSTLRRK
ncbi:MULTISPECIES: hypothetical protein [Aquimarina]|uniref:Lipocalin family protein n=1 Tax=Aquimarina algiphila TaxID=2047982 RepID=A0A554VLN0_9FLAO|nr:MULTISPECIES: hypothetical protein [Aquimarina]TSE09069.1 hypothetical protein FOF46_10335 [Aquimarina algiphila]